MKLAPMSLPEMRAAQIDNMLSVLRKDLMETENLDARIDADHRLKVPKPGDVWEEHQPTGLITWTFFVHRAPDGYEKCQCQECLDGYEGQS